MRQQPLVPPAGRPTIRLPEEFKGAQLVDLSAAGLPQVSDDGQLTLTLGSRDFFWLRLDSGSAHG